VALPIAVAGVLAAVALAALTMAALGRAAARADEASDDLLAQTSGPAAPARIRASRTTPIRAARLPSPVSYAGVAGLAEAQETISREPSMTVPSSRTSVGTMRLPVNRSTS
jgi:hypothetical protein